MTTATISNDTLCEYGQSVISLELAAIQALAQRIDQHFARACEYLRAAKGHVVVLGMGKSGYIAHKIAATLASTGTPAFFIHPGEANHGDMGMITSDQVVLMISNSGETDELLSLLPAIRQLDVPLIALTGQPQSTLAQAASVHLDVSVAREAGPFGLAPTSSTTAALVMGDALAIAVLRARAFSPEDFARHHPGGALGRRLLLQVNSLMHTGNELPAVSPDCLLAKALVEMTEKRLGMTTVQNAQGTLLGVFTDGDLRRALDQGYDVRQTPVSDVMSKQGITGSTDMLAIDALNLMEQHGITALVLVDSQQQVAGVVHLHQLVKAGIS